MNKRRLTTLIKFMEKLPKSAEQHFQMRYWYVHDDADDHKHKIGKFVTRKTLEHCGTRACALGWASTIPSLQKAGLKVETKASGPAPFNRARRVFGLTTGQADELFVPGSFEDKPMNNVTTPKQWARRARGLIAEWSK